MNITTTLKISNELEKRCFDVDDHAQIKAMISYKKWRTKQIKFTKKNKEKADEPRGYQTHGEGGNFNQQGEVARGDSQITQQTVHVFAVPEL